MIGTIRGKALVENGGKVVISTPQLVDGSEVEFFLLVDDEDEMDATDYLLSTQANRERMELMLEELKHPENFIPLDMKKYEEFIVGSESSRGT